MVSNGSEARFVFETVGINHRPNSGYLCISRASERLSSRSLIACRLSYSFLASGNTDYQLGQSALADKRRRGTMVAGIFSRPSQSWQSLFIEQELAVAPGLVIVIRAVEICGYVHILHPYISPVADT